MSYTVQLRRICEGLTHSEGGFYSTDYIIKNAAPKLFDFDYPMYETDHKPELEQKIIQHYYMNEIGQETVGLFRLALRDKMQMIMPYYFELYKTRALEFDILNPVDYTKTGEDLYKSERSAHQTGEEKLTGTSDITGTSGSTQKTTGNDWQYNNDTPQGGIDGLRSLKYLSSATHNTADDTVTSNGDSTQNTKQDQTKNSTGDSQSQQDDNRNYRERVKGRSNHTQSDLIAQYRANILNIDAMIVDELAELFLSIW